MKPVLDAAHTRALESAAEAQGTPSSLLMERAGTVLAQHVLSLGSAHAAVLVLCGRGNNGGDGLVTARLLLEAGRAVQVQVVGGLEGLAGEPAEKLAAYAQKEGKRGPLDAAAARALPPRQLVVVDALLGTGLNRAPTGEYAEAIRLIAELKSHGAKVVAADVPSGVQSDSGKTFDPCVEADLTVCFGTLKVGAVVEPGASVSGQVVAADIGLPPAELEQAPAALLESADVLEWIAPRKANSHKGTFGHLLVIAGSRGKSGAAALSALASLRSGVGLCTVATPEDALDTVQAHAPEIMGHPYSHHLPRGLGPEQWKQLSPLAKKMQALVLGPGIPRGDDTPAFIEAMLGEEGPPVLIDADGLNALAQNLAPLARSKRQVVLTPHPGEMATLLGRTSAQVQADRLAVAREFAREHRVTLVLKGSRTLVASAEGRVFVNPTGNPGMATGGTGDVLSGIIGALLAQGLEPVHAASAGVFVHGASADRMRAEVGEAGLVASDIIAGLGNLWAGWGR